METAEISAVLAKSGNSLFLDLVGMCGFLTMLSMPACTHPAIKTRPAKTELPSRAHSIWGVFGSQQLQTPAAFSPHVPRQHLVRIRGAIPTVCQGISSEISANVCNRRGTIEYYHPDMCIGMCWSVCVCVCVGLLERMCVRVRACVRAWVGRWVGGCVRACVGGWVRACVRG